MSIALLLTHLLPSVSLAASFETRLDPLEPGVSVALKEHGSAGAYLDVVSGRAAITQNKHVEIWELAQRKRVSAFEVECNTPILNASGSHLLCVGATFALWETASGDPVPISQVADGLARYTASTRHGSGFAVTGFEGMVHFVLPDGVRNSVTVEPTLAAAWKRLERNLNADEGVVEIDQIRAEAGGEGLAIAYGLELRILESKSGAERHRRAGQQYRLEQATDGFCARTSDGVTHLNATGQDQRTVEIPDFWNAMCVNDWVLWMQDDQLFGSAPSGVVHALPLRTTRQLSYADGWLWVVDDGALMGWDTAALFNAGEPFPSSKPIAELVPTPAYSGALPKLAPYGQFLALSDDGSLEIREDRGGSSAAGLQIVDVTSGRTVRVIPTPVPVSRAQIDRPDRLIYVLDPSGQSSSLEVVVAVDLHTGTPLWTRSGRGFAVLPDGRVAIAWDNQVQVFDDTGHASLLDGPARSPHVVDGVLWTQSPDGTMHAWRP